MAASTDPLAGLLPTSDPFAPFDLQRAAVAVSADQLNQSPREAAAGLTLPGTPTIEGTSADAAPLAAPQVALVNEPVAEPRTAGGRAPMQSRPRRAVPWIPIALAGLALAMLGGIAVSAYLLSQRDSTAVQDELASSNPRLPLPDSERPASITDDPAATGGPFAQGLGPALAAAAHDASPGLSEPQADPDAASREAADQASPGPTVPAASMPVAMDVPEPSEPITAQPDDSEPIASAAVRPDPPRSSGPMVQQPSPAEQQAQGERAYQAALQALRTQDWPQIKSLAQQAKTAAAGPEQVERASQLYQLADLAEYYHGGIVRALEELEAGAAFDLVDDLKVGVVEADASMLHIRYIGREKIYAFDEIPLVLVHKIGRFTMDAESPTAIAAKAAFQSVCRLATPADRQQAIEWLSRIDGEIEGANAQDLQAAIARLDSV